MGRRKIEIKMITNKAYLKSTFSKRRKGLFRKAAELCDMCGAEIAILTVSPGGKFYNFGHPKVDSIVARYSGDGTSSTVDENHDCDVSHEDDDDEHEKDDSSSDAVDEDEDIDGRSLSISLHQAGEEDKEPIGDQSSMHSSSIGISHKFWWDEEEPVDPEERSKMYICSLEELRNNVMWLLNDRKMRESYVKDYIVASNQTST